MYLMSMDLMSMDLILSQFIVFFIIKISRNTSYNILKNYNTSFTLLLVLRYLFSYFYYLYINYMYIYVCMSVTWSCSGHEALDCTTHKFSSKYTLNILRSRKGRNYACMLFWGRSGEGQVGSVHI